MLNRASPPRKCIAYPPERGLVEANLRDKVDVVRHLRRFDTKGFAVKKKYIKPALVKLGNIKLIKSNHTGPSSDGKRYAGFFK